VTEQRAQGNPQAGKQAILLIFLLSGFAGLVYEVVWARQLVLVFGNTTQAVSAILTGFFGGMALGSVVGGRIADRVRSPLRMYAILEMLVVIAVLLTRVTFGGLHEVTAVRSARYSRTRPCWRSFGSAYPFLPSARLPC
jgi:predicted MFS family arabinose efflux permease